MSLSVWEFRCPRPEPGKRWIKLSAFAREWNKSPETIRLWCVSGFILTLGFKCRQSATGRWTIQVPNP